MREGRRVRNLRLRAATPTLVQRGALLLEDALRTASLPDPGRGRVLFIRSLSLGVIHADRSPSSLALALERRVQALARDAVHAEAESAPAASAVYFADPVQALVALAARLSRRAPVSGWFWPLVVPEAWGKPLDQALRAVLAAAMETEPGPAAAVALVDGLMERGAAGPMLGALRWVDGPTLLRATWGYAPAPQRGVLLARAPSEDLAVLPPRARALAEAWIDTWGPEDARSLWLAAVVLSLPRPARVVTPELPARALRLVAAIAARTPERRPPSPEAPGPAPEHAPRPPAAPAGPEPERSRRPEEPATVSPAAPRSLEASAPPEGTPEPESPGPPQAVEAPRGAVVAGEDAPAPGPNGAEPPAPEAAVPGPEESPRPTRAGGLLFLVHVLEHLGVPELLAANPRLQELAVAEHFLAWEAERLEVPPEDPVLRALRASELPSLATPCDFTLPERFRAWARAPGPSREVRVADGRVLELDARGRMVLAVRREGDAGGAPAGPPDLVMLLRTLHLAAARVLRAGGRLSLRALVLRPARVSATRTHLDLLFDHQLADLRVRRAGLDVDPGWIPWLGLVIRFHYLHGELPPEPGRPGSRD